jgi:hypothetical protein
MALLRRAAPWLPRVLFAVLSGSCATAPAQAQPRRDEAQAAPAPAPPAAADPRPAATPISPAAIDPAASPAPPAASVAPVAPTVDVSLDDLQRAPRLVARFHAGRNVHVAGAVVGLLGNGLSLTSIILTSVYGLDQSEDTLTSRLGPGMAYAGAAANGAAFIMSATGIGLQHSALQLIGQDTGRGLYASGTALGVLGLCGIGTSYFFRFSNYVDNSSSVAFGASITAAVLLTISGVLYFIDATRVEKAFKRLPYALRLGTT